MTVHGILTFTKYIVQYMYKDIKQHILGGTGNSDFSYKDTLKLAWKLALILAYFLVI